jgi:hypothetical protein
MKKLLPLSIAGILICTALGAAAFPSNTYKTDVNSNQGKNTYTHTVFVEVATSQACGPCHSWNQAMHDAYVSGNYDFEYVEMIVYDHNWATLNNAALAWNNLFGITSYPTSEFDGGYQTIVGNAPSQLPGVLNTCGARAVANIVPHISISWLGSGSISVSIQIQNNGATQYNGFIRVPITEVVSRYTTAGNAKYNFGFLDYAFPMNQVVSIAPGGAYTNSVTWIGSQHQDTHGQNFGDIVPGNIQVDLAVFNNANNYLDGTAVAIIQVPPNVPSNPNPVNGATSVNLNADLSWTGGDPNPHDTVTYDVFFGTINPPPKVASNISTATYDPGTLTQTTTYYWKIVAWDNHHATATGPLWNFVTRTNHPPNVPSSPSPSNGSTNVPTNTHLSWIGGDPDSGDTVKYDIYFGTTNPPPKIASNQTSTSYDPGSMGSLTLYYWKIVSRDYLGLSTVGPVWHFTTKNTTNVPPGAPVISGETQGKTGAAYTYVFTATDPNDDDLYYYITWGDGSNSGWLGPYHSGTPISVNHTWAKSGTYTIQAKARDIYGLESGWGTLQVKMPLIQVYMFSPFLYQLLCKLLERFPILAKLIFH